MPADKDVFMKIARFADDELSEYFEDTEGMASLMFNAIEKHILH